MLLALPCAMQGAPAQGQPVPTAPLCSPCCQSLPGVWQWNKTKPALPSLKYCWALQSHILVRNYCILTLQYFPDYFPPVPALKIPRLYPLKSYRLEKIWFQNNLFFFFNTWTLFFVALTCYFHRIYFFFFSFKNISDAVYRNVMTALLDHGQRSVLSECPPVPAVLHSEWHGNVETSNSNRKKSKCLMICL